MARARGALFLVAIVAAPLAWSDVYTWTDDQGRVQYSDHPPKNFKGPVRRMEVDEPPAVPLAAPKPAAAEKAIPAKATDAPKAPPDMATKRRAERARLQHDLDVARDKLDAARKALAEHQEPQGDERQVIQRPGGDPKKALMPGNVQISARSNCREVQNDGKKSVVCPVSTPNEAYYEHIAKLEEAVKKAEDEVADAERAYRRGVD